MVNGKTATNKQPERIDLCGDCANGTEIKQHWNKALNGTYICVRCQYSSHSRLKSERACNNFKQR